MDDDEFNDFQQAPQPYTKPASKNNGDIEPLVEEQGSLSGNNFAYSEPELIIPSSALATKSLEAPSSYSESSGLGGSPEPPLSKMQSEKLAADSNVFLQLDKNYSYQDRRIEGIGGIEVVPQLTQGLSKGVCWDSKESLAFQQLEAINIEQQQAGNDIDYLNEKVQKNQASYAVKVIIEQTDYLVTNTRQQTKNEANEQYQGAFYKYAEEANITQPSALENQEYQLKFQQSQQNQTNFLFLAQSKDNIDKKEAKENVEQVYLYNQTQEIKRQNYQDPQDHEADEQQQQFGDFEETIQITQENTAEVKQASPTPDQEAVSDKVIEEVLPSKASGCTRKQELQQFVNSLPDYSFLFADTFQSF